MFAIKAYENPEKKVESNDRTENSENNCKTFKLKWISIILMTICVSTINTVEIVYFNLGETYFQYSPMRVTASMAASLISSMTAGYTIGQAVNFFIAMIVKTEYIISYHFLFSFLTLICLIFANNINYEL